MFGTAIKAQMKRLGLKQQAVAKAIGVSQPALSQILAGKQALDALTFARLCAAVGISCDQAAWLLEL